MINMKIWEKHFIYETLKTALFFLVAFYGLYALIDYASHTGTFHHHHSRLSFQELLLFYASEFFRRADVLIPLALLIGTARTLTTMNVHHELLALQAAGVSLRKLMRPFIWVGLSGVLFLYGATEWVQPFALRQERKIEDKHTYEQSAVKNLQTKVNYLKLEDGSTLLFQFFDKPAKTFYDLIWIRSPDEFIRMKSLTAEALPKGTYVENLVRKKGNLTLSQRYPEKTFADLKFSSERLIETVTPPEERQISELLTQINPSGFESEKEAHHLAVFLHKMILPWLALFAVLIVIPPSIQVVRDLNVFSIYAVSLFALVFVYIAVNAGTTLAERQVMNPYYALLLPFTILFSFAIVRYLWSTRS